MQYHIQEIHLQKYNSWNEFRLIQTNYSFSIEQPKNITQIFSSLLQNEIWF
jgi:hypothetical protein